MRLRPILLGLAIGLLPVATGSAPADDARATDAAFAARAAEVGYHAAFIEYLAPDAVLFRPEAVRGQEWLAMAEPASGRLEWSPSAAAADCTGRLAVTIGPWRYSNADGGETAAGHYLSVWRLDAQAGWQVVLDHGIDHAADASPAVALQAALSELFRATGNGGCKGRGEAGDLARAEEDFNSQVARGGLTAALPGIAADGLLVFRDDRAPTLLRALPPATDAAFGPGTTTRSVGTVFEPGTNLAVTHGVLQSADGGSRALYVRVWNRERRQWRVAVDLRTPLPTP